MHPTISYHLAQARVADLRYRAQRGTLARAARRLPRVAGRRGHAKRACQNRKPPPRRSPNNGLSGTTMYVACRSGLVRDRSWRMVVAGGYA
jgi:hypothetical protein